MKKENHPEYLFEKKPKTDKDKLEEWDFVRVHRGGRYPYDEDPVEVAILRDGAVFFSSTSRDSFIYLYPEQVKKLMSILRRTRRVAPAI
jgi:hypothetical protein